MYLLDTNVVSEPKRARPASSVIAWLAVQASADLFMCALAVGELRRGVLRLGPGARRTELTAWLAVVTEDFGDRILPIDARVADAWAELAERNRTRGLTVGLADELIAATALANDLTLVTRNVRHFDQAGCRLFDPWGE